MAFSSEQIKAIRNKRINKYKEKSNYRFDNTVKFIGIIAVSLPCIYAFVIVVLPLILKSF